MPDLVVITPSRGRPNEFARLVAAVRATTDDRAAVWGLVDDDDPYRGAYLTGRNHVYIDGRRSLVGWTNWAAEQVLAADGSGTPPTYLASLGDDHVPITPGWDRALIAAIEALPGPGFAYGNDLLQGERMPTAWVAHGEVVRRLGWMMLPTCEHLYVDTAVRDLGRAAGRIAYVPEVVIEHRHPVARKADWDESYRESNSTARYEADRLAFQRWCRERMPLDADLLRSLVWERAT